MINLTVVNIKELIKNLVKFIAIVVFIILCTRFFYFLKNAEIKNYIVEKIDSIKEKTFIECIDENISLNKAKNSKTSNNNVSLFDVFENMFTNEIRYLKYFESIKGLVLNEKDYEDTNEIELATGESVDTQVKEENNITEVYNKTYNTVKIKNESKYTLTASDLKPDVDFENKSEIVIYHTHTCESYTKTEKYTYKSSGNFRTTDLNYSVARVGSVLTDYLEKYNFKVTHDITYHDYPQYNGSYTRSLKTVTKIIKTSKASLVIDLHRDAVRK